MRQIHNVFFIPAKAMLVASAAAFSLALASSHAGAAVLMFDFGPTPPDAATSISSPYHTAAGASFTGSTWNMAQGSDVNSGILYADGSAATGVQLDLGRTATNATTFAGAGTEIELDNTIAITSNALTSGGGISNAGVFTTNSVGRDGIFSGTDNDTAKHFVRIGAQVRGLEAGVYDVYVVARNSNLTGREYGQTVYAGSGDPKSVDSTTFDYSGYSNATVNYLTSPSYATAAWETFGDGTSPNYVKITVTLSEGEALNIAVAGTATTTTFNQGQSRGFLNMVQIVQVPEPASAWLLSIGGLALGWLRKRRAA